MKRSKAVAGIGLDSFGGALIDPTTNVLNLVKASNERQDDLRQAYAELNATRASALAEQVNRSEQHARELGAMRSAHAMEIRELEQDRLRTIRSIDAGAIATLSSGMASFF